jgi:hypothetical protein
MSGSIIGEDRVDIVQLTNGSINASIPRGTNEGAAWKGAVVGSKLAFRFANRDSGGYMTIAADGRSMKGHGREFGSSGCHNYGIECGLAQGLRVH